MNAKHNQANANQDANDNTSHGTTIESSILLDRGFGGVTSRTTGRSRSWVRSGSRGRSTGGMTGGTTSGMRGRARSRGI